MCATLALVLLWRLLPVLKSEHSGSLASVPLLFKRPALMALYMLTIIVVTAHFTAYSYIEPFIQTVAGLSENFTTLMLLLFGAAGIVGSLLFVSYEICLSLSLGYANTRLQAIEVGMINYLWPCFTVLMALALNGQKAKWWLLPGLLLSLFGIGWIMSGEGGWSPAQMLANVRSNPLSYTLAFSGAVIWALYCNLTKKIAQGSNGV
ncbi:hypothetical protein ACUX08_26530, partial [Salmonella enterica]